MADSFKIDIAGEWSAAEFAELFADATTVYNYCFLEDYGPADELAYRIIRSGLLSPRRFERYSLPLWRDSLLMASALPTSITAELESFLARDGQRLKVRRVHFESPGFVDLLGAGKAIGHLRKFIEGVIDRIIEREDRELAREEKRQDILEKKIKNAEAILNLSERFPVDDDTRGAIMRELLRVDASVERKVIAGKIVGINRPE